MDDQQNNIDVTTTKAVTGLLLSGDVISAIDLANIPTGSVVGEGLIKLVTALVTTGLPDNFDANGGIVLIHVVGDTVFLKSTANPHDEVGMGEDDIHLDTLHICPVCGYRDYVDFILTHPEAVGCECCAEGITLPNREDVVTADEVAATVEEQTPPVEAHGDHFTMTFAPFNPPGDYITPTDTMEKDGDGEDHRPFCVQSDTDSENESKEDTVVETDTPKVNTHPKYWIIPPTPVSKGNVLDMNIHTAAHLLDALAKYGLPINFNMSKGGLSLMADPVSGTPLLASASNPYQWIEFSNETETGMVIKCRCSMCGCEGTLEALNWNAQYDTCGKCE